MMQLSKSDYMLFLKHPAWLWLKKHDKGKLPKVDEATQVIFDAGFLFESYAEQIFPDALKIKSDWSDFRGYQELTPRTQKALKSGATTILQGRFEAGEITCICDVLKRVGGNTFDLYEIKSSTSVKPEHEPDLAFQVEVLERSDYQINDIYVVHVNNQFIKKGEIKVQELATITKITDRVKRLKEYTKANIKKALEVIKQKEIPDISPANAKSGAFSDWLAIYKTLAVVEEYSIYDLCFPAADQIGQLEKMGIKKIVDIPGSFPLDLKQQRQVQATKSDQVISDEKSINKFLSLLKYPLCFLDYETLASVVPYFDGLGPYKQLPFQYSLHVLEQPDGELKHFEYLHQENENPLKPLTESLKSNIGTEGTVLVWYEAFEKGCNQLMAQIAPGYQKFYRDLNSRIIDLMLPFSSGAYIHKNFYGSASIKKVLPVLIPELSYKDLDIHEGTAAQRLWMEAVLEGKRPAEKEKNLSDLIKYCQLDTLAMVRIYQFLTKQVNQEIQQKLF